MLPEVAEDVSVTVFPAQKVVDPLAVMVGVLGDGFIVITTGVEFVEVQVPTTWLTV